MSTTSYLILGFILLVALLITVHFVKKSEWWRKVKETKSDVSNTFNSVFGWIFSPFTGLVSIAALWNPSPYNYINYLKAYDFTSGNPVVNVLFIVLGVGLLFMTIYLVGKAGKKLGVIGYLGYFLFLICYIAALVYLNYFAIDETARSLDSLKELDFGLHGLVFVIAYAAWGMIYPRLSKSTHKEYGTNEDDPILE